MTDPETRSGGRTSRRLDGAIAGLIACVSFAWFAFRLNAEPLFVDEAAYISQAYFGDLFFAANRNSPLWLEYAAYDLPPLPKYLINASLRMHALARPERSWSLVWYTQNTRESRFVTPPIQAAARLPFLCLGAAACALAYGLGVISSGRVAGCVAAALLAWNPLFALHARRAMSDVSAEAFILATVLVGLGLIRSLLQRKSFLTCVSLAIVTGALGALAVLSKLNGGLGLMAVVAGLILLGIEQRSLRSVIALSLCGAAMGGTALLVFIGLNPFVTARPSSLGRVPLLAPVGLNETITQRLRKVVDHRVDVSRTAATSFPNDALTTPAAKLSVLIVQGFGRFGPFGPRHSDSTKRFSLAQDWGVIVWMPVVATGLVISVWRTRRQRTTGAFPVAFAPVLLFVVSVITVGAFLPLAWDRYLLSIQSGSAVLAGVAVASLSGWRLPKAGRS